MQEPIGRLDVAALDCPDHRALAEFYHSIIGGEIVRSDDDWAELHTPHGNVAFQKIEEHRRPTWPRGDIPQQAHLDIRVADLDVGEAAVVAVGAVKAETQPMPDSFRVFIDPAGHPFCLVRE